MCIMGDSTQDAQYVSPTKYEYLDHTADVQLHAWGETLEEAFEQCAVAMFGYMTDLERVELKDTLVIEANGHDLESLLYQFLDEFLYHFSAEPYFVAKKVKITDFSRTTFKIKAKAMGETFQIPKHSQEAEVKAITYSAMQIIDSPGARSAEVFVIVDI